MSEDLSPSISESAKGPAKGTVDGQSFEQHKLSEQIEADRYLASKEAAKKKGLGIKMTRVIPPGAV